MSSQPRTPPAYQTIENLRGEIEFRRKLFEQQVGDMEIFASEYDGEEIAKVLRERMSETITRMRQLRAAGYVLSPYLELGAERGQRALAMENELGCEGAALDISFDLLKSCEHYADRFALEKLPFRLCADAYHLPFRSNSLPFVFCYQTLHHFPDPTPIIAEIHRVLAPGGLFFFAEEPFQQVLRWELYQVEGGAQHWKRIGRLRKLLDRFFSREVFREEEFGVIENHSIPLREWRAMLHDFAEVQGTLSFAGGRTTELVEPRNRLKYLFAYLLGGGVSALCRKAGEPGGHAGSIEEALACPVALRAGREVPLVPVEAGFEREDGEMSYASHEGIAFLLEPGLKRELFPEMGV